MTDDRSQNMENLLKDRKNIVCNDSSRAISSGRRKYIDSEIELLTESTIAFTSPF